MADPLAATRTQLRNIQSKTGKTIAQLHALLADSGMTKVGEYRSLLMAQCQLGYGDANAVALLFGKPIPVLDPVAEPPLSPASAGDPLDAIYAGAKSHLRPLHAAVMAVVAGFGTFEEAPKKSYVSLRRKKQFAMLGPATKDLIEIGLNAKDLPHHARLKVQPPGAMCQATTRIASVEDINSDLTRWLKQAFDAAG